MFSDGKAFGAEIVAIVKDYVAASLAPLSKEIETLRAMFVALEPMPGPPGPPGPSGPGGADGVGLASAIIDRSGCLLITCTDGAIASLGKVVGEAAVKEVDSSERFISAELADEVAKAISKLAESAPVAAKNNGGSVINLNIAPPSAKKKIINTRRDEAGNLVADVVEQDA